MRKTRATIVLLVSVTHFLDWEKSTTKKVKEVSFNPNPFYPYPFRSYLYSGMDRNLRFSKTLLESSRMNQSSNLLGMEKKVRLEIAEYYVNFRVSRMKLGATDGCTARSY